MNQMPKLIDEVIGLLYPPVCITCGNRLLSQEEYLCMDCWLDLPVSRFHPDPENKVFRMFWGRVTLESGTAYFQYRKGSRYQKLIHFIKYKGLKELGFEAGKRFGEALMQAGGYSLADIVVPVPLHRRKQASRGYNQSEWIAMGIAEAMGKPLSTGNLIRHRHTPTQTRKNRFERWKNVEGIFSVNNMEEFENMHILLVDDVVTTGSTLEACAAEILKCHGSKVSIATLAYAEI
jgi:ComF family protein